MEIRRFVWDIVDSNTWLVLEDGHGLLIDAVDNTELYNSIVDLKSITIILTHSHFDHISGLNRIRDLRPDSIVIATEKCSEYLGNVYRNMSSSATVFMKFYESGQRGNIIIEPFTCAPANIFFENEFNFEWHGHKVKLTAVHGHSDDSLVVVIDDKVMFSGDTLLGIPTITRFPTGSSERFWFEDVPLLKRMRDGMTVYPGHGHNGKIEDMLAINKVPKKYREIVI